MHHERLSLTERLGFAGLAPIELPLLAALVTGDPLLLVGTHGTAKSALTRALARTLDLRFHAYDASKALFEDIVGFPDPASLARGEVAYVPTPLSLWDKAFILVDELSRANPPTQNKWLEVVRARSVMGMSIPGLRYVFAAMNPLEYPGATALDPALAGRFTWIVRMPDSGTLAPEHLRAVVGTSGEEDAPLATAFRDGPRAAATSPGELEATLQTIRDRLPAAIARWDDTVRAYVVALCNALPRRALDGRRLAMLRRNLIVALTMNELGLVRASALRAAGSSDRLRVLVEEVVFASMPFRVTGEAIDDVQIGLAHVSAWRASFDARGMEPVTELLQARSAEAVAARWPALAPQMCEEDHDRVLTRFTERANSSEGKLDVWVDLLTLTRAVLAQAERFPAEIVARLVSWYAQASCLVEGVPNQAATALHGVTGLRAEDPAATAGARLALGLGENPDQLQRPLERFRAALRAAAIPN